jgi:F-type H+-transporting ATPase subunit b
MPKPVISVALAALCSLIWLLEPLFAPLALGQEPAAEAVQATPAEAAPAEAAAPAAEPAAEAEPATPAAEPAAAQAAEGGHPAAAEAAAGHEGEAGAEHESEGYDSGQWRNFIYRIMNFAVYIALLYFLLRKPVSAFLGGRRDGIARQVEYLETQARNYEEQAKVMRRKIYELTADREEALKRYEAEGAKERERIVAEATKAAELIVQRTATAMEQEIKAARRILTVEAGRLAMDLARDLLAKSVTSEDQARLAHEFVEQVVKLPFKD